MSKAKTFLDNGKFKREEDGHSEADYTFNSPSDFFSTPTNLIPALSSTSGGRIVIGDKSALQAIPLIHREAPLVKSVGRDGDTPFVEHLGFVMGSVFAKDNGEVTAVTSDELHVKHGNKDEVYDLYDHHSLSKKTYLHNTAVVKVGDRVKKGRLLAKSNYSDEQGHSALGTNLTTAIMPYRSGNFEDAFVVTESGAKKLAAEQLIKIYLEKNFGVETGKQKYVSLFLNKYNNSQLGNTDEDGVAKKGVTLHKGDPVILAVSPKTLRNSDLQLGNLSKALRNAFKDASETWDYEHPGTVSEVSKSGGSITVTLLTKRSLQVSDKVNVAFGNKGVVGSIVRDSEAPTMEDGKPVDIILNSMSITSRVSPALPIVMAIGKVAQKTGKPINVSQFNKGSAVDDAIKLLKEHGVSDKEKLYDPVTGRHLSAFVGPMYVTRLVHNAEDKISERGQGGAYTIDWQPSKLDKDDAAKRVGNLSTTALLSSGATAVLKDIALVRSVKNDEYWRRLKLGQPLPSPKTPFIFDKFIASLRGAGVKVDKKGDIYSILPQTDKDITEHSFGAIENASTYKIKKNEMIPEKGGLFDPAIVGVTGEKYNHIDLKMGVPNPISEEYLRKLLKVTQKQYEDLIVSGEIKKKLDAIHVDQEVSKYEALVKSTRKTDRDNNLKILIFLKTLQKNNLKPSQLFITKVPVIPSQYRPITVQGDMVMPSPVNLLYKDLILNNNTIDRVHELPEEIQRKVKLGQYNAVKAIYGLGDPITRKNQEKDVKGLLATMLGAQGGSAKGSVFQSKVVNKPLDLVGRGVLVPDAALDLDEASIPQEMIWKLYKPFVIRRLVMRGIDATKALEYVKAENPLAKEALMEEIKDRPGIVSRDPALHKFNLTGFFLRPNADPKDKSIKLHPLTFKSFGADSDGDALNVQIPVSSDAKEQIKDRMLPSKNLLSPRNFAPVYVPSNESGLGLYQASTVDNKGTVKKYKSREDVLKDFHSGKLEVGDRVEIHHG